MMPLKRISRANRGQALAETALILGVLLFIIFVMIESARLFQANLTVQNAAREAGRYAITGNFDPACLSDTPPCADPRLASIRAVAKDNLTGLQLDPTANYDDPKYYFVEVWHNEDGNWVPDSAGGPGDPVMVRVTYRVGIITPFVNAIARTVRVTGQVVFNNEEYNQYSNNTGSNEAPDIPPPPTPGPSPTPAPPDLEVTKTGNPDEVMVGETVEYFVVVRNLGDLQATGVVLTDTLPAHVTVTDADGCGGAAVLTCTLGTIPGGGSASVTIKVEPQAAAVDTTITNKATARANEGDLDDSNNSDSADTKVVPVTTEADLEIQKSASSDLVAVDDTLSYNLLVINHGLATATDVTVSDLLPANAIYDGFDSTDAGDSCSIAGADGDGRGGTVTCVLGDMLRDTTTSITIYVRPQEEEPIMNEATVTASSPEPTPNDYPNADSVDVTVKNIADLGVSKNLSPNPGLEEPITYTLRIFNNGPADATGVSVDDRLPTSVDFVGFGTAVDDNRCSQGGNIVTCNIGNLADGAADFVRIVVRPTMEAVITNTVTITGTRRDPYLPNNKFSLAKRIQARADMEVVSLVDNPDPVASGDYLDYTVVVRNNGPSETGGAGLVESLPPNTTFVSASATRGTCSEGVGVVICNFGELGVDDVVTVKIRLIPTQYSDGAITTEATAFGAVTDPNLTNNVETATTLVEAFTFMTLNPICGPAGSVITIRGYNWSANKNENLIFTWDPSGPDPNPTVVTHTIAAKTNTTGLSWTETFTVPQTAAWRQEHTIHAATKSVADQSTFQVPCPAPDLEAVGAPTVISPTTAVRIGDDVTFAVEIANSGDHDAINQFFVGLYFDPEITTTTHISQENRVALQAVSNLAAARGRILTFTVPSAFGAIGEHRVYAVVDSDPAAVGLITTELDEFNNVSSPLTLSVVDNPDITPTPVITPTATPADPGGINGIVYAPAPGDNTFPQQNVEVFVFNGTGETVASTFTNNSGEYFFTLLEPLTNPPGYTMLACIEIDGILYSDSATGVPVSSGAFTRQDFVLAAGMPCVAP